MKRSYYPIFKAVVASPLVCYVVLFFACFAVAVDREGYWWPRLVGASALVALVIAFANRNAEPKKADAEWLGKRRHRIVLFAIVAFGAFLRFAQLDMIPYGVWFDEAQNTIVARQILNDPEYWPLFISDLTQLPAFPFYIFSPFVWLFPERVHGVRFVAACFGVGAIFVTYLLARELFNKPIALLAALFVSVSRWHITFSRFGMCQVFSTFFLPLVIYYYIRAARTKKFAPAILCGLLLGLALQTYYVSIVLIPLLVSAFIWAVLNGNHSERPSGRQVITIILAALIAYSPLLYFAYNNWEAFSERFRAVSDVSPRDLIDVAHGLITGEMSEKGDNAYRSITEHLLMFHIVGDNNGRHNLPDEPMLDPLTGALFLLGIFTSLIGFRRSQNGTLLLWFFGVLSAGIFSLGFEAPQAGRTIPLTPLIAIFAAHGFAIAARPFLPPRRLLVSASVTSLIAFCVFWNLFIGYKQIVSPLSWGAYSTAETKIAEILAASGENKPVFVPESLVNGPTQLAMAKGFQAQSYQVVNDLVVPRGADGATIILTETPFEQLEYLKKMYPRAEVDDFLSPPSPFAWSSIAAKIFTISRADIEALHVPRVSCRDDAELVQESSGEIPWKQFKERFRCTPIWQAGLSNERFAYFTIRVEGNESVSIYVDRQKIVERVSRHSALLQLPGGFHLLEVVPHGDAEGTSTVSVTRSLEKVPTAPQAVSLESPAIYGGGLTGSYYKGASLEGFPQLVRNDPNLHIYFHYLPLNLPFSVRWKGFLRVPADGFYKFIASSIDTSKVYIDGKLIIDQQILGEGVSQQLLLNAGSVPIMVEYRAVTGYSQIMLQWKQPGQNDPMPIPAKYFAPDLILENKE